MKSKLKMTSQDWILFLKLTLKSALILTAVGMTVWQSQENKGKLPMENVTKEEVKDRGDIGAPIIALCPRPNQVLQSLIFELLTKRFLARKFKYLIRHQIGQRWQNLTKMPKLICT